MSGEIKVYNGTVFNWKPVKVWNGTAWVTKPLKFWNGTAWVPTNVVGGSSTLSAPIIGYPSPIASNPTTLPVSVGSDWQSGDVLKVAISTSASMSSPTILTHTITDADLSAGTFSVGLSGVTLAGVRYLQAYGAHSGSDSTNKSGIVAWGDTASPTITTASTQSITETLPLAVTLSATDAGSGVPALVSNGTTPGWLIVGGVDQLQHDVAIVGGVPKYRWINDGSQLASAPLDQGLNNTYTATVRAIDYGGNFADLSITTTVNAADLSPTAFSFTDVTNATRATLYTASAMTLAGVTAGVNVPVTVTGGEYQKNGGSWLAGASFTMQLGDTLNVRQTSSSSYSTQTDVVVAIGSGPTVSDTFSVTTANDPAAASFAVSPSQPADFTTANGNSSAVSFAAGRPVVFAKQGFNPSAVSIVGAGGGGSDVACTKVKGSTSGDFGLWVANADVAAGSYPVKVVSGGSAVVSLLCGTLSGSSTPTAPSSTAIKDPSGSYSLPTTTSTSLTIPSGGVGVLMGFSTATIDGSNLTFLYNSAGAGFIARKITSGSLTPQISSSANGSGFTFLVAAAWGP